MAENQNTDNQNVGNNNVGNTNAGNTNAGNTNAGSSNGGNANAGNSNAGNANVGTSNAGNSNAGNSSVAILEAKIAEAVAAATAKLRAEYEEKERLSKLTEDERRKYEAAEFEKQKAAFAAEKIKFEAAKELGKRNLPIEFTEYLTAADEVTTLKRIAAFETTYKAAIEKAVKEKLKGNAPPAAGENNNQNVSQGSGGGFLKIIKDNQARRK